MHKLLSSLDFCFEFLYGVRYITMLAAADSFCYRLKIWFGLVVRNYKKF